MSKLRRRSIISVSQKEDFIDYLCFCANNNSCSISIESRKENGVKSTAVSEYPSIEYSRDKKTWIALTFNSSETINIGNTGDKIFLRGNNPNGLSMISTESEDEYVYSNFTMRGSISASGNIQTLLDQTGSRKDVPERGFAFLFRDCDALISAPNLPATTLSYECYARMFMQSSIVEAPELPAKTLCMRCYVEMFSLCESLTRVGKMAVENMAEQACEAMYSACSSLRTLPKINALYFPSYAMDYMFSDSSQISIKKEKDETHQIEYRIPFEGDGSGEYSATMAMFLRTDTDLPNQQPELNTVYYTSNELV